MKSPEQQISLPQYLRDLMHTQGSALLKDTERLEQLLGEMPHAHNYGREIFALMTAQRMGFSSLLTHPPKEENAKLWLNRQIFELRRQAGFEEKLAQWTIKCWFFALQRMEQARHPSLSEAAQRMLPKTARKAAQNPPQKTKPLVQEMPPETAQILQQEKRSEIHSLKQQPSEQQEREVMKGKNKEADAEKFKIPESAKSKPRNENVITLRGRRLLNCICILPAQLLGELDTQSGALLSVLELGKATPLNIENKKDFVVAASALSPDHSMLALGGWNAEIKLFAVKKGDYIHSFQGPHQRRITALAFSHDSSMLVSGDEGGVVCVWSADKGTPLYTFKGHSDAVSALAFSLDDTIVAVGDKSGEVSLWNLAAAHWWHFLYPAWQRIDKIKAHEGAVSALVFNPVDGSHLVSGGSDGRVVAWHGHAQQKDWLKHPTATLLQARHAVKSVVFAPNGEYFAAASGRRATVWHTDKLQLSHSFEGYHNTLKTLAFSHDGKVLTAAARDDTLQRRSLRERKFSVTWQDPGFQIRLIDTNKAGDVVLFGTLDKAAFDKTTVLHVA